jgi:uncharacterized protein YbcI
MDDHGYDPTAIAAGRPGAGTAAAKISTEMVRLVRQYTGRGPTKARTTLNTNLVAVLFHEALTRGEQSLAAAGQFDAVQSGRRTFHEIMRGEAVAVVEGTLHRGVTSFLADVDVRANTAVMVFALEPEPETDQVVVGEADGDGPLTAA